MVTKVLKMSAVWCSPCSQMDKQIEKNSDKLDGVEIVHIDIDASPELAKKYNIRSIPTLIKLDVEGNEVARSIGSLTEVKLLEFLS
jgi:thiol-disulfide isomerase/thioredoxin